MVSWSWSAGHGQLIMGAGPLVRAATRVLQCHSCQWSSLRTPACPRLSQQPPAQQRLPDLLRCAVQTLAAPPPSAYLPGYSGPPTEQPPPAIGDVISPGDFATAPLPAGDPGSQISRPLSDAPSDPDAEPDSVDSSRSVATSVIVGVVIGIAVLAMAALTVVAVLAMRNARKRIERSKADEPGTAVRASQLSSCARPCNVKGNQSQFVFFFSPMHNR